MSVNRKEIGQLLGVAWGVLEDDTDGTITYENLTKTVARISRADLVTLVNRVKNELGEGGAVADTEDIA